MITAKTIEELESKLEKGIAKAQQSNPVFEIVEFGHYRVKGSKGNFYEVRAGRQLNGDLFIACLCPGALHKGGCYHASAAFLVHTRLAQKQIDDKRKSEMDNAPYLRQHQDKQLEKIGKVRI